MGETARKYGELIYDYCKNSKLFSQKDLDSEYRNFTPQELSQALSEYYKFIKSNEALIDNIVVRNKDNNLNLFYRGEKSKEIDLLNKSTLYYNLFFLEDSIYQVSCDLFERGFKHKFGTISRIVQSFKNKLVYINFGFLIPIPKYYLTRQEEIILAPIDIDFRIPKEIYQFLSKYYSFRETEKAVHTSIIYESTKFEMDSIKDYSDFKLSFPDTEESYNFKSVFDSKSKLQKSNAKKFYKGFTLRRFLLEIHYNQLNSLKLNSRQLETNILTIDLLRKTQPQSVDLKTHMINLNLPVINNLDMIKVLEFRTKEDRIIKLREYLDLEISSINEVQTEKEKKEKIKELENYINKDFSNQIINTNKEIFSTLSKNTLRLAPYLIADMYGLNNTFIYFLDKLSKKVLGDTEDKNTTFSLIKKRLELKRSPLSVIYDSRLSNKLR